MSDIQARLEEMPLTAIVDRLEEIAERRTLDWQDAALLRYAAEALRAALAAVSSTKDSPMTNDPSPQLAGLLLKLNEECEAQHARAEAAERERGELAEWKSKEQSALLKMGAELAIAGSPHAGVVEGVEWMASRLSAAEEALRDAVEDAEARWDMNDPRTNPGIKAWVEKGRAALSAVSPRTSDQKGPVNL